MALLTKEQVKEWGINHIRLWNAGDKKAWEANWRKVAPAGVRMLDPVGTDWKTGYEECFLKAFDLWQPYTRLKIHEGPIWGRGFGPCYFIAEYEGGIELVWVLENYVGKPGDDIYMTFDIENYRFDADGTMLIRAFYDIPELAKDVMSDLTRQYHPEDVLAEQQSRN